VAHDADAVDEFSSYFPAELRKCAMVNAGAGIKPQ
jgi:hypothetical protein